MGLTYRERQQAKAERLREWADKRDARADAAYEGVQAITERIPFGQPILVGHHSEAGARADQRRIESGMDAFCAHSGKAREMRGRADGIERGAAVSIYSDDADALERLREKLAGLEARREAIKTRNAEFRKANGPALRAMSAYERDMAMPHRKYELSNLGGVIASTRKRITELEAPEAGRQLVARYEGACRTCGETVAVGDQVVYYRRSRTVECEGCAA